MSDPIKRGETTHIGEVTRTAIATTQWFAENRNLKGAATHPITGNNKLAVFICGEEGFADICAHIKAAEQSIDLICWGFDPGMELVRGGGTWPRGETYGDLLIAAGKRKVKVRLLVWYDWKVSRLAKNMPGYSHGKISSLSAATGKAKDVSARFSLDLARLDQSKPIPGLGKYKAPVKTEEISLAARAEYCDSWYKFAFGGELPGITVRRRHGDDDAIYKSLESETDQPGGLTRMEVEKLGMAHAGTHHQKTILIDYAFEHGSKAVGYVMGLNSVTDFWDTAEHKLEDPRREQGSAMEANEGVQAAKTDPGFRSMKPYRDYICRIDAGGALIDVANNFISAWDRAKKDDKDRPYQCAIERKAAAAKCTAAPPSALLGKAKPGDSIVQIVRTQPEEQDKTIKEVYFQATDIAALAGGYLYVENQYFQYEEWARRLMQKRKDVIAGWNRGRAKSQKSMEDMPVMHVFIVIPVPEWAQMIPRTYDTLATLGQHGNTRDLGMTGQNTLIKGENEQFRPVHRDEFGRSTGYSAPPSDVVQHANSIAKPDAKMLENTFGLKVSVAMLQTCGVDHSDDDPRDRWRYREVYIHSKLLLINDGFFTLGSANLNQRSMATDSEINIATNDAGHARELRHNVWTQLSGGLVSGGGGTKAEIVLSFKEWTKLMNDNRAKKYAASAIAEKKKMQGFLLPLEDNRSSTMRLT